MLEWIQDTHGLKRILLFFQLIKELFDLLILQGLMAFLHFFIGKGADKVIGWIKKTYFVEFPSHIFTSLVDNHEQTFMRE